LLRYFDEVVSAYAFGNIDASRTTAGYIRRRLDEN
jgi:hypothetical protein